MYLDKNAILNKITKEDIIKICMDLGSEYPRDDGQGNLIFQTSICHRDGDSWKLYYYTDSKMFHCYTCSDSYGIIQLVIRANKLKGRTITFYNALKYIGVITGNLATVANTELPDKSTMIDDWTWLGRFNRKKYRSIPELKEYNENVLQLFDYDEVTEWVSEGISRQTLSEFEIGFYFVQNCITIPVRDINGRLIGVRARYLLEEDIAKGKYRPISIENETLKFNTGQTFYGLYQNQENIKKHRKVFLFESEKSVLLNHTFYGDNDLSLAVCGSNITDTQMKILLKSLEVCHVVVCFDKEYHKHDSYEAEIYYHKLLKKVEPFLQFCTVELVMDRQGLLNYKDSPVDQGQEVWNRLLEDKIQVTREDINMMRGE